MTIDLSFTERQSWEKVWHYQRHSSSDLVYGLCNCILMCMYVCLKLFAKHRCAVKWVVVEEKSSLLNSKPFFSGGTVHHSCHLITARNSLETKPAR